jgi:hypothetical protein
MRHEPESKKRKLIQEESGAGIYSGDPVSISSGHKTEHLPEATRYTTESQSVTILPFADIVPVSVTT